MSPDKGYRVEKIANAFLHIAAENFETIDPMKLQKLVYLAHGLNLALYGKPLTDSPIKAWRYGPVIQTLYDKTRRYGSEPITEPVKASIILDEKDRDSRLSEEVRQLMLEVWEQYGGDDALALSSLTHNKELHEGWPWYKTWELDGGKLTGSKVIPNELIEKSFKNLLK